MKLFWKNGYDGTALADILTATGLAKGSIYKAFKSKYNLYLESLSRYEEIHVDAAVRDLLSEAPALTRIDNFLSSPIKDSDGASPSRGCFLCNASADPAVSDPKALSLVQRGFNKLAVALKQAIAEMKPDWNDDRTSQVAESLLAIYSGLRVMSRSGVKLERLEAAKAGGLLQLRHPDLEI